MPLPETADVGKIMEAMKGEHMPHDQKVAIALDIARKHGAKIPKKKVKRGRKYGRGAIEMAMKKGMEKHG